MAKKLLILSDCGTRVPEFDPAFEVTALPVDAGSAQRLAAIRGAEIIIGEPSLEELQYAPNLKWLQMTWAGADRYLHGGFRENVILTFFGVALGMVMGKFLHQWLVLTVEIDLLMFGRQAAPASYLYSVY